MSAGAQGTQGSVRVSGAITALNPQDGLFLRAEHLQAIEDYAETLARTVGTASGTGVVYGFDLSVDATGPALDVGPGLAIGPTGRSLRSTVDAAILLGPDVPGVGTDGFWVVTVAPDTADSGTENVYGTLCADPCSSSGPGSTIRPWRDEGVRITLVPDSLAGLDAVPDLHRRSWLASKYFERERRAGGPWLVPADDTGVVPSPRTRDWTSSAAAPAAAGVPLGTLQLLGSTWTLDVWTARRDVGVAPGERLWRSRLGMRPWNVFLAQVAQFQDQLVPMSTAFARVRRERVVDEREAITRRFVAEASTSMQRSPDFRQFREELAASAESYVLSSAGDSLWDRGFDELPPAGVLYGVLVDKGLTARLDALFGPGVDVRIRQVRADEVLPAFDRAQHRDRIPLHSDFGPTEVDVLVPSLLADLPALRTDDYPWLAFVRREAGSTTIAPVATEEVVVYHVVGPVKDVLTALAAGRRPDDVGLVGTLEYPVGDWAYPGGKIAAKLVQDVGLLATTRFSLVAAASEDARRPLAAQRATLFGACLDEGTAPADVWTVTAADGPEVIVVVQPLANS